MEEELLPVGAAAPILKLSRDEKVFLVVRDEVVISVCDTKELALEIIKECCDFIQYNEFKNNCNSWVDHNKENTEFILYSKQRGCFSTYEKIETVFAIHQQEKNVLIKYN